MKETQKKIGIVLESLNKI